MTEHIVSQLSDVLEKKHSLESFVRQLLSMLGIITGMESVYLAKIEHETNNLKVLYSLNLHGPCVIPEGTDISWEQSLCRHSLEESCCFSNDADIKWPDSYGAKNFGIKTYLSTPVYLNDGSIFGSLCAASGIPKAYSVQNEQILRLFAGLIAQHIEKDIILKQLQQVNQLLYKNLNTDVLTGLFNRRAVYDKLHDMFLLAKRIERSVIIAFIDLDDFKAINDYFGHEVGDELLKEVSLRLVKAIRTEDIIGRLGGDEFIIAGLGQEDFHAQNTTLISMKKRIEQMLEGQYELSTCCFYYIGASVGIVVVKPDDLTIEDALKLADSTMYAEKKRRKECTMKNKQYHKVAFQKK